MVWNKIVMVLCVVCVISMSALGYTGVYSSSRVNTSFINTTDLEVWNNATVHGNLSVAGKLAVKELTGVNGEMIVSDVNELMLDIDAVLYLGSLNTQIYGFAYLEPYANNYGDIGASYANLDTVYTNRIAKGTTFLTVTEICTSTNGLCPSGSPIPTDVINVTLLNASIVNTTSLYSESLNLSSNQTIVFQGSTGSYTIEKRDYNIEADENINTLYFHQSEDPAFAYPYYDKGVVISHYNKDVLGSSAVFQTWDLCGTTRCSETYGFWGGVGSVNGASGNITSLTRALLGYGYFSATDRNNITIKEWHGMSSGLEATDNHYFQTAKGINANAGEGSGGTVQSSYAIFVANSNIGKTYSNWGIYVQNQTRTTRGLKNISIETAGGEHIFKGATNISNPDGRISTLNIQIPRDTANNLPVINVNNTTNTASIMNLTQNGSMEITGTFRVSKAETVNWELKAQLNTACTTTCTYACVMGFATNTGGDSIVSCTDATADKCICAGPN